MELIIKKGEAAKRPSEAGARDQKVEQQLYILILGVECVQISVLGAEVVLRVRRDNASELSSTWIQDPKLRK